MRNSYEDVSSVLEGSDLDLEAVAGRNERGLEALPMDYVVSVGGMLAFYKDYRDAKTQGNSEEIERSFKKFSAEANRASELRKMFASNQAGLIDAQKEIRIMLDQYGLGVAAVEPEAVYGEMISDEDFARKLLNREPIGAYDRRIVEMMKEAGI